MAGGSFNLSSSKERVTVWANWWEQDINVESNTSVVGVAVYLRRENNGYTTYGTVNTYVNVDGQSQSEVGLYFSNNGTSDTLIFAKTYTVSHNDDGSKSVTINISFDGNIITGSGTATVQLDTIARASQITISQSTFNVGDDVTVYTNQKSDSFTHYLYLRRADGLYYAPVATGIVGSYNINNDIINDIIYSQSANSATYNAAFLLRTYNGNTEIGDTVVEFTAVITNSNPTVEEVMYTQTNEATIALTGNDTDIVNGQSAIQVEFSGATAYNYAAISKYVVSCGGAVYESETSTITVDRVTNDSVSCWVVDSRGFKSGNKSIGFSNYYDYFTPVITSQSIQRLYTDWTKAAISFKLTLPQILIDKSAVSVKCGIAESGSSQFEYIDLENPESTEADYSAELEKSFEIEKNYIVKLVVTDSYGEYTYGNLLLQTAEPELSIRKDRVGINCIPAEGNGMLQIGGKNILDLIHPVGSYYWSSEATDPSELFGGTWERVINRFILAGGKYEVVYDSSFLSESCIIGGQLFASHADSYLSAVCKHTPTVPIYCQWFDSSGNITITEEIIFDENNEFITPVKDAGVNIVRCVYEYVDCTGEPEVNYNLYYEYADYAVGETGGKTNYTFRAAIGACNDDPSGLGYVTVPATAYQNANAPDYIFTGHSSANFSWWNHSTPVTDASSESEDTTIIPPYTVAYCWKRVE